MLEGVDNTAYSDIAPLRPRLLTPGGALTLAGAAETALTVPNVRRFGYLFLLEAVCTVAGTTAGTWTLRDDLAASGGAVLVILQQPVAAAAVGTKYCWAFPVAWKSRLQNTAFTIQANAATLGTWVFLCNGFNSAV